MEKDDYTALERITEYMNIQPQSTTVMPGIARTNHELENYGTVRRHYQRLQELEPKLAETYRYLDLRGEEAGRVLSAEGVGGSVIWAE
ncbi:MAG: hypothetical protein U5P10_13575 [Spirochaetia bacterium]|nr:hypothetical protein [Spirochaetia bacterium]